MSTRTFLQNQLDKSDETCYNDLMTNDNPTQPEPQVRCDCGCKYRHPGGRCVDCGARPDMQTSGPCSTCGEDVTKAAKLTYKGTVYLRHCDASTQVWHDKGECVAGDEPILRWG